MPGQNLDVNDPDRDFIINGAKSGFRITNLDSTGAGAYHKNHRSALSEENRREVEKQIQKEISNGRYIKVSDGPKIVSGLAAISKGEVLYMMQRFLNMMLLGLEERR